jgi:hypothetical protein
LQPEFSIARFFLLEEYVLPLFRALDFGLNCQPFYPAVLKEVAKNNGNILTIFSFLYLEIAKFGYIFKYHSTLSDLALTIITVKNIEFFFK